MKAVKETKDCYFVWQKNGHKPKYVHETLLSAENEALRLAKLRPGTKFLVLHAISKIHVPIEEGMK